MELDEGHAWYVAYGSNLCRDRLMTYLEGTRAPDRPDGAGGCGPTRSRLARYGAHRGCADPAPPGDDRWLEIGHDVSFRGRSRRWDGGVAFLDLEPAPGVATEVRAWLLTRTQILGLAAQEARLPRDPDPSLLDGLGAAGATARLGGGWYDTLLRLPDLEGRPAVTVTTSQDLPVTDPTAPYLATIAVGRSERPGRRAPDAGSRPVRGSPL